MEDPKKLIAKAQAGDGHAFGALYERYYAPLYRYLYVRVSRREDVEDLVQTVFLKAYRSLDGYRDRGKEPLAFLYTIARNAVIDHRRRATPVLLENDGIAERLADDTLPAVERIAIKSDHAAVLAAMRALSDDQQEILALKFLADLSNAEIAQLLGKREDAIRQLQSRGLRALRDELQRSTT